MSPSDLLFPFPGSTARLSEDGNYRYELARRWAKGPAACWIMLNPSTADATLDDPTVRRVRRFSQDFGMGALYVVNLFAYRTPFPKLLVRGRLDSVGPENDDAIHDAVVRSRLVVVAWGVPPTPIRGDALVRAFEVLDLLRAVGRRAMCLGKTADGWPRHPVRLAAHTPLQIYEPSGRAGEDP